MLLGINGQNSLQHACVVHLTYWPPPLFPWPIKCPSLISVSLGGKEPAPKIVVDTQLRMFDTAPETWGMLFEQWPLFLNGPLPHLG